MNIVKNTRWGESPDMRDLRQRNEQRLADARQRMGSRHLLHPENRVRYINSKGNRHAIN